jgi:hypothetical protein
MNSDAKLYFFMGLARAGISEALKLSPDKKTDDELKAYDSELKNLSPRNIDIEKVFREFFFFSPVPMPERTSAENTVAKHV